MELTTVIEIMLFSCAVALAGGFLVLLLRGFIEEQIRRDREEREHRPHRIERWM